MTHDALHDRGKAMEDVFFRNVDQQLLDRMKADVAASSDRTALMAATGIQDENVINHLMEQGISGETLASVGLIPLVAVAWADGKMEDREREAILNAARETGITKDHASYVLLNNWLENQPQRELLNSWKEYIGAMKESLDSTSVEQIKTSVVDRARKVADSAGGFLGVHKTSEVEKRTIDELVAAFD